MELKDRLISKINRRVKQYRERNEAINEEAAGIRGFHNLDRYRKLHVEMEVNKGRIDLYRDILSDIQIFSD